MKIQQKGFEWMWSEDPHGFAQYRHACPTCIGYLLDLFGHAKRVDALCHTGSLGEELDELLDSLHAAIAMIETES